VIVEKPVEVIKEVPVELIKEVFREMPREVIKEVEVIKYVDRVVEKEVLPEEREKMVERIVEVPVDRIVEKIVEVPVEREVKVLTAVEIIVHDDKSYASGVSLFRVPWAGGSHRARGEQVLRVPYAHDFSRWRESFDHRDCFVLRTPTTLYRWESASEWPRFKVQSVVSALLDGRREVCESAGRESEAFRLELAKALQPPSSTPCSISVPSMARPTQPFSSTPCEPPSSTPSSTPDVSEVISSILQPALASPEEAPEPREPRADQPRLSAGSSVPRGAAAPSGSLGTRAPSSAYVPPSSGQARAGVSALPGRSLSRPPSGRPPSSSSATGRLSNPPPGGYQPSARRQPPNQPVMPPSITVSRVSGQRSASNAGLGRVVGRT